jgi:hypothetical protein
MQDEKGTKAECRQAYVKSDETSADFSTAVALTVDHKLN